MANEEDILEDLAPEENLVTDEAKRIELEDLVEAHLVPGGKMQQPLSGRF